MGKLGKTLEVSLHDLIVSATVRVVLSWVEALGRYMAKITITRDSFDPFETSLQLFQLAHVLKGLYEAEDDRHRALFDADNRKIEFWVAPDKGKTEDYYLKITLPVLDALGKTKGVLYTFSFKWKEFWKVIGSQILIFANQAAEEDLPPEVE